MARTGRVMTLGERCHASYANFRVVNPPVGMSSLKQRWSYSATVDRSAWSHLVMNVTREA